MIQVAFGHGHPVTSGSPAIDYFVSSDLFETSASIEGRDIRRAAGTGSDINAAVYENVSELTAPHSSSSSSSASSSSSLSSIHGTQIAVREDRHRPAGDLFASTTKESHGRRGDDPWRGRGDGTQDYTEQLVLFDSLTASLPEAFGPPNEYPDGRATRRLVGLMEGDHGYHCIQHSKKFHPDFDPVLRGVLQGDSAAKILLTEASKVCSSFHGKRRAIDGGGELTNRSVVFDNNRWMREWTERATISLHGRGGHVDEQTFKMRSFQTRSSFIPCPSTSMHSAIVQCAESIAHLLYLSGFPLYQSP